MNDEAYAAQQYIANHGNPEMDSVIFKWAIRELNPSSDASLAADFFSVVRDCYLSPDRIFHSLGHPRSLLPSVLAEAYQRTLDDKRSDFDLYLKQQLLRIDNTVKVRMALETLAVFYHDIVHKDNVKPRVLENFKVDDRYVINVEKTPVTFYLSNMRHAERFEELSCLVAEMHMQASGISIEKIVPVVLAILATIPFSKFNEPIALHARVMRLQLSELVMMNLDEVHAAIDVALAVSQNDLGSFAYDELNSFNEKTCAIMLEHNPKLRDANHSLQDEIETISVFFRGSQKLLNQLRSKALQLFFCRDKEQAFIDHLNQQAEKTIGQDVILQGLQLSTLLLLKALVHQQHPTLLKESVASSIPSLNLDQYTWPNNFEISSEIANVLGKHGEECEVNGVFFKRGISAAKWVVVFTKAIGIDAMLKISHQYPAKLPLDPMGILNIIPTSRKD